MSNEVLEYYGEEVDIRIINLLCKTFNVSFECNNGKATGVLINGKKNI